MTICAICCSIVHIKGAISYIAFTSVEVMNIARSTTSLQRLAALVVLLIALALVDLAAGNSCPGNPTGSEGTIQYYLQVTRTHITYNKCIIMASIINYCSVATLFFLKRRKTKE